MKPRIINFYGGPGSGRSRSAAATFAELKWLGFKCHYVQDFRKDLIWQGRRAMLSDPSKLMSDQPGRLLSLIGKVDVIVTDAPILLDMLHLQYHATPLRHLPDLILEIYNQFENIDIFMSRSEGIQPIWEVQSSKEACERDAVIVDLLDSFSHGYHILKTHRGIAGEVIALAGLATD